MRDKVTEAKSISDGVQGLLDLLTERDKSGLHANEMMDIFAHIFGEHPSAAGTQGIKCWLDALDWFQTPLGELDVADVPNIRDLHSTALEVANVRFRVFSLARAGRGVGVAFFDLTCPQCTPAHTRHAPARATQHTTRTHLPSPHRLAAPRRIAASPRTASFSASGFRQRASSRWC